MMKSTQRLPIALLLSVLLLLCAVACGSSEVPDDDTQTPIGPAGPVIIDKETSAHAADQTTAATVNYAPDFEVLDADGKTVKLSELRGKPVVLNFWATWCPPCKAEMPDLQAAYETYGKDVCFVMVNLTDGSRDTVDSVKAFVADNGYTFPVYFDTQSSAAIAYSVYSIPNTYFINAEGEIVSSVKQMITADQLEAGIRQILGRGVNNAGRGMMGLLQRRRGDRDSGG